MRIWCVSGWIVFNIGQVTTSQQMLVQFVTSSIRMKKIERGCVEQITKAQKIRLLVNNIHILLRSI